MKKIVTIITILVFVSVIFSSCKVNPERQELYIFAASSLTESLSEIEIEYEAKNPDVDLIFNFDSSGTLKTQLEYGAYCDVFISASNTPMNELYSISENRVDLLKNKVSLVVSENNPADIKGFNDLVEKLNNGSLLLCVGNADVPVGEYTLQIFDYYNVDIEKLDEKGVITYGSSVKEVTSQVKEGLVDCAIVYETDAKIADLEIIETADEVLCSQVVYPAAVIETSENKNLSIEFLNFLQSSHSAQIFKNYGFTPIN